MSKSIHTTYKDLKEATKAELEEMVNKPDSILHKLADKRALKKRVKKERKLKRKINNDITTGCKNHNG